MSCVCIDAGHGGKKPGAEYKGLIEKDVNLKVALRTGEILEAYGDKIVYTRKDDSHVELMERCNIANDALADIFVSIHCLTGDTKIKLLNGKNIPIRELEGIDEFFVYSYNYDLNKIDVGRGSDCRKTGEKVQIFKVFLDNGEEIKCTKDHKFLTRCGDYKEVKDLVVGDSLMSLITSFDKRGYEQILHPDGEIEKTHAMSDRYNLLKGKYNKTDGYFRHHKNFRKLDNDPTNLLRLTWFRHYNLHIFSQDKVRESNKQRVENGTHNFMQPEWCKRQSEIMKIVNKKLSSEGLHAFQKKDIRERIKKRMIEHNPGVLGAENQKKKMKELFETGVHPWVNKEWIKKHLEKILPKAHLATKKMFEEKKHPWCSEEMKIKRIVAKACKVLSYLSEQRLEVNENNWNFARQETIKNAPKYETAINLGIVNHKIVSIEPAGYEDVYDFTVEKYHNFALSAGIFVHNCNATDNDAEKAKGEEIWIYEGSNKSKKLAECLADEVDAFFPDEPFRGIKETQGLVVLHYTNMPAALIELGFIDRSSTNASFQDPDTIEKISQLIATGANEYLNI